MATSAPPMYPLNATEEQQRTQWSRLRRYFKPHWKIITDGFPLALYGFLTLVPIIGMMTLGGHDSLEDLDTVSLFIAADFTIIQTIHFASGLAFQGPIAMTVGARDWVKVRDTFQRAIISSAIIFVLVGVPSVAVSKWVFQLFGQTEDISMTTTICLVIGLPGEFSFILYTMLYRTMIAQLMVWPVVASGAFLAIVGICLQYLAFCMGWGAVGLVAAYCIANLLTSVFFVIVFLAYRSQRELELFNWTRAAFTDLWEMMCLFLKAVAYQFSMRLFVEVGTIVIGLLGETTLAAQSILLRYAIVALTCAMGFWSTAVALMGRAAGAGKRDKFFATFAATLTVFAVMAAFTFFFLLGLRYPLAYASTSLESVQSILISLTPIVAVYSVLVIMWIGSHSLALSLGRVNVPTFATVFAEFCIGIPTSMVLTFLTSLELFGFYIGIIVSYSVKIGILWTYYACYWNDFLRPGFDSSNPSESSPLVSTPSSSASPQPLIDEGDKDHKSPSPHDIARHGSQVELSSYNDFSSSKAERNELTSVKAKGTDEPATKPKK